MSTGKLLATCTLIAAASLAIPVARAAQPLVGDEWIYYHTFQAFNGRNGHGGKALASVTVSYLNTLGKPVFTGDTIAFGLHSETCLFDVFLREELWSDVSCDEPLPVGKQWAVTSCFAGMDCDQRAEITGTEAVTIAGKNHQATVIETRRSLSPLNYGSAEAKYRRATYWYVPELKGMARITHELFDDDDVRLTLEKWELQQFVPARPASDTQH